MRLALPFVLILSIINFCRSIGFLGSEFTITKTSQLRLGLLSRKGLYPINLLQILGLVFEPDILIFHLSYYPLLYFNK